MYIRDIATAIRTREHDRLLSADSGGVRDTVSVRTVDTVSAARVSSKINVRDECARIIASFNTQR